MVAVSSDHKRRTQRPDLPVAGSDDEGPVLALGHFEQRLAALELDPTSRLVVPHHEARGGIQKYPRSVRQGDRSLLADVGRKAGSRGYKKRDRRGDRSETGRGEANDSKS